MARRSAPPGSGPSYLSPSHGTGPAGGRRLGEVENDESAFQRFYREQIVAPQYLAGNLSILTGAVVFVGGIVGLRMFGEALSFGV